MSPVIGQIAMILAFLTSLTIYFAGARFAYLRWFPLYLAVTWIVQVIGIMMANRRMQNTALYNFLLPSEICFYLYLLYQIVQHPLARKMVRLAAILFVVFVAVNMIFLQKLHVFNSISYAVGCLLTVAFCIYYFFELFQSPHPVNVARLPSFWICAGLLFFYACTFPLFGLINFLRSAPQVIINNLSSILTLLNVLLYTSFTIAFLCRIRIRSSMS